MVKRKKEADRSFFLEVFCVTKIVRNVRNLFAKGGLRRGMVQCAIFLLFVCLEHNWMEVVVEKCMDIMFLTLLKCSHAVGKLV